MNEGELSSLVKRRRSDRNKVLGIFRFSSLLLCSSSSLILPSRVYAFALPSANASATDRSTGNRFPAKPKETILSSFACKRLTLNTQENKQSGNHRSDSTAQSEGRMHTLMSTLKPILRYGRQERDNNAWRGSGLATSKEGSKIVYKNRKDPISDTTKDGIQGGSSK